MRPVSCLASCGPLHTTSRWMRKPTARVFCCWARRGGLLIIFSGACVRGWAGWRAGSPHAALDVQGKPQLIRRTWSASASGRSPAEYAAEVKACGATLWAACSRASCWTSKRPTSPFRRWLRFTGPATGIVGVDWGVSYDRSVAVASFRCLWPRQSRRGTCGALRRAPVCVAARRQRCMRSWRLWRRVLGLSRMSGRRSTVWAPCRRVSCGVAQCKRELHAGTVPIVAGSS